MQQSGFVRFAMLGDSHASGSCNLKGRIINPNGSYADFNGAGSADFYEYGGINSSVGDPLANVNVRASSNGAPVFSPGKSPDVDQIFVRKGQKIRLYPDSWNGTWTVGIGGSGNVARSCGSGRVMSVDPRPALICRGYA